MWGVREFDESKKSDDLDELVELYNTPNDYLWTFVYGTLRPGEGNYWIDPEVVRYWEPVSTKGRMYAAGIPFVDFVNCGEHERVVGTVLMMEQGPLADSMVRMERGAGYIPLTVPVVVSDGQFDVTIDCLVWQYERDPSRMRWADHVPSGDFRDTDGSYYHLRVV